MKTLLKIGTLLCGLILLFAHFRTILAVDATDARPPEQSSAIIASPKEAESVVHPLNQTPTIEITKPTTNTKPGLTAVATVTELKTALENGQSVQLTADITLSNSSERIQLGKNIAQDITIDGADPLTGQHHRLDIVDSSVISSTTHLHFGANFAGKTIKFTNLKITNNNYYGLCHPTIDSYSKGSNLLLDNIDYTSSAQALHFMYGVIAFSGNNTITQTAGTWSQEFAETGRLDFRGGTTTINHAGGGTYGLIRIDQNPTDSIAPGIQVSGGAQVSITTNNAIFPSVGLGIPQIDIESKGSGSNLTINAGSHIFAITGTNGSKTVASDGGSINITKASNFYQTGTSNRLITATNDGHINLQLSGTLYNLAQNQSPMNATDNSRIDIKTNGVMFDSSQSKSPLTADQKSIINLTSDNNLFDAYIQDSPISATNESQINLNAGKDLFAYIYNATSGNPPMQITADATSEMNLIAKDAFIRNAQANGLKFDISGKLVATFGQYFAISSERPFFHDFHDNSTVDLTINGAQSAANGLIPLGSKGAYMKIGDHSKITINNQTTTSQSMILGAAAGNSPVTIGDSDVTFNNNAVADARVFEHINLNLESPNNQSPHTIYRGIHLTEKNQIKTIFPFVHFSSIIDNANVTSGSDDTFNAKLTALANTKDIAQLHLHAPLPPEILTFENSGGFPETDEQQFNFDLNGTATPGSELNVNFLNAAGQLLLGGPKQIVAANQDYQYQWQTTLPTEQHRIVLDANYPAPYTLANPTRRVLKDLPPPELAFLKAPTHFEFSSLPLTNSQSPTYSYDDVSDADLLISDPRPGSRGNWAIQVNLTKPFTAEPTNQPESILQDALIWTKGAQTTPLQLNIPQQLFKKDSYTASGTTPDIENLTDLLKATLQAQFPAGPKHADVPYNAELEFILISAPN